MSRRLGQNSSILGNVLQTLVKSKQIIRIKDPPPPPPKDQFRGISEPVTKGDKQIHKELTDWALIGGFDFLWKPRAQPMHPYTRGKEVMRSAETLLSAD
jgi:hypothetical protein